MKSLMPSERWLGAWSRDLSNLGKLLQQRFRRLILHKSAFMALSNVIVQFALSEICFLHVSIVSQITASPGSPTTSQMEFSVSNRRACCPDLWQSLWGYHSVQFSGPTLFSVYVNDVALAAGESLIHLYADNTILYTSGPSLDKCVNKPPNEFQCHTTLLPWPPTALKC